MSLSKVVFVSFFGLFVAMTAAMAEGENIVASKHYVDTVKQNKIPASGTNSNVAGDSVITYTSTAGEIGERGIYDGGVGDYSAGTDGDNVVTASVVANMAATIETLTVPDNKFICANNDCTLWEIVSTTAPVARPGTFNPLTPVVVECRTESDCTHLECSGGYVPICVGNGSCQCVDPAVLALLE